MHHDVIDVPASWASNLKTQMLIYSPIGVLGTKMDFKVYVLDDLWWQKLQFKSYPGVECLAKNGYMIVFTRKVSRKNGKISFCNWFQLKKLSKTLGEYSLA